MQLSITTELQVTLLTLLYALLLLATLFKQKHQQKKQNAKNNFSKHEFASAFLIAATLATLLYFLELIAFTTPLTKTLLANSNTLLVITYVAIEELFWRGHVAKKLPPIIQVPLYAFATSILFSSNLNALISNFVNLAAISAVTTFALYKSGKTSAVLTRIFLIFTYFLATQSQSIPIYLTLLLAPITFLYFKSKNLQTALSELRLTAPKQPAAQIARQAAFLVIAIFLILVIETLVLTSFKLNDSEKVAATIQSFPLIALAVAVTIGPIAEEVFFRGFLQKKLGVVITAVLFGALHFGYGSITEVIGALSIGLLLGWWVKYKNSNLWPVITAHVIYNAIAITIALTTIAT